VKLRLQILLERGRGKALTTGLTDGRCDRQARRSPGKRPVEQTEREREEERRLMSHEPEPKMRDGQRQVLKG
jgi:hypothetical protein